MQSLTYNILFLFVYLAIPAAWAHDEPFPGNGNGNGQGQGQGQENNNRPISHPGQKILHTEKGKLNGNASIASGGPFASHNIELLSQLTLADMGAGGGVLGNDIWGWTDPLDSKEYALVGRSDGTAFVDITDPVNPVYLGFLATHTGNTAWRDIKEYANYAYIVSDNNGAHGMQVFDLTLLRSVVSPPVSFSETAHYSGFTKAHNILINEATGFAYAVGTNNFNGGLHFIDLGNPTVPVAAGGFGSDGYTHDAQVVSYAGPDTAYSGREITFNSNTDTLTIVDVTDKNLPVQLSRTGYTDSGYTHQGWLTEDHAYFISNDELDERNNPLINFTRTHLWDVADLDAPIYIGFYEAAVQSIDHNLYVHNGLVYEGNYTSGLRVLDHADIANGNLTEVAYIDTHPAIDSLTSFNGVWSVYPYFPSGSVIIGDRNEGLIVVRLLQADLAVTSQDEPDPVLQGAQLVYTIDVTNNGPDTASNVMLTDMLSAGVSYVSAVTTQGSCSEAGGTVSCSLGSLINAANATVTVTVTAIAPGVLNNTVSASADEIDSNAANNTVTPDTTVLADSDGDGLDDAFEMSIGTNPLLPDSDTDGVTDYDEVAYDGDAANYTPGQDTNPLSTDTDNDGHGDATDPLPLLFNFDDGDLAPLGAPDGLINSADLFIAVRIITGDIQATDLEFSHGDLYPPGAPDGIINTSDLILIQELVL